MTFTAHQRTMGDMAGHELLTQQEVARLFRVDGKTIRRWRQAGKLTLIRTPGGAPRYLASEIRALLSATDDRPGALTPPQSAAGPVPPQEDK